MDLSMIIKTLQTTKPFTFLKKKEKYMTKTI